MSNLFFIQNKCGLVRQTCQFVVKNATLVKIHPQNISPLASQFQYKKFNQEKHNQLEQQDDEQYLKFLFVVMSCNYCFWPLEGFQYQQLANNIKKYIQTGVEIQKLSTITEQILIKQMFSGINVPLANERARCVRQVCGVVQHKFKSSFKNVIQKANKSAVQLLNILTSSFPNFQDHSIYQGHQIHFYKRAQLLVAFVWIKYQGKGLGEFIDISELTMFADYRVPQILNQYQILEYNQQLQQKIISKKQIQSGSPEQIEIRSSTVVATQMIKDYLNKEMGKNVMSCEVDQFLWQLGEANLGKIVQHHRTLTMFY